MCPACGHRGEARTILEATDRLYHTTERIFRVVECKACRLLRLDPFPSGEELRRYYPSNYWYSPENDRAARLEEIYRRFVLRDHLNFVLRALADAGEKGPVVDVGSGGGLFLRMLGEHGFPGFGLDNSTAAASVAWRSNRVSTLCGDLARSPVQHGTCAAVTMFHVLEHVSDPVSYLDSAKDLLLPNGRLIIQVPNASSWQFLMFGEYWNGVDVPRHLINYRQRDLEKLLNHCGFEVLRRKHFSLRDNPAGFASSLAPGLDPMARRVRGIAESGALKLVKDLAYFGIVVAALPFTLLEAACGAGSTIMIEARRKR